jgi:hypothetical protein
LQLENFDEKANFGRYLRRRKNKKKILEVRVWSKVVFGVERSGKS